jgi:serine protease
MYRNHPDIPCTNIRKTTTNCIGQEFGLDDPTNKWHNPIERYHGTHVAGTIGATIFNNDGVRGVLNDGKYCFIIGRVFGEGTAGAKMSSILSAIEWIVSKGANVINLSLSTSDFTRTGQTIIQNAHDSGAILVAAAGNEGISDYRYPASYTNVLSVAAVDSDYKQAEFSQYNDAVDIAAPGVDILSTFPLTIGGVLFFDTPNLSALGQYLKYSVQRSSAIKGKLVNCAFGTKKCRGSGGHICLLQR